MKNQKDFKAPRDYFEQLPEKIINKVHTKRDLAGFRVKSDYFKGLEHSVISKLPKESKVLPLYQKIGIAAAVVIGAFLLSTPSESVIPDEFSDFAAFSGMDSFNFDPMLIANTDVDLDEMNPNKLELEDLETYLEEEQLNILDYEY